LLSPVQIITIRVSAYPILDNTPPHSKRLEQADGVTMVARKLLAWVGLERAVRELTKRMPVDIEVVR
jgi:hypothetical protein